MPDGATTRRPIGWRAPEAGPEREPPTPRRVLVEEAIVVLALSLLPSAVDALFTLFEEPVSKSVAFAVYPSVELARQLSDIVFSLAPVALVLHLARRNREDLRTFGLGTATLGRSE